MNTTLKIPTWKDKTLFTPGPLTTSRTVKQALLRDLGSRDYEFISIVADVRQRLLEIGGVAENGYEAIIMQGSGTFSLESVVSSTIPRTGKLLVIINGAYGRRIAQIAGVYDIEVVPLTYPENRKPELAELEAALSADEAITSVAVIHCETTTGLINPIKEIGEIVKRFDKDYFVDAMSSFGAIPFNLVECGIDYLVSSANKCIEGIPGFGIILVKRDTLLKTEGYARTFSLDLLAQLLRLEKDGQFRFTPPTHSLIAYHQALLELEAEGGVEGRGGRYRDNCRILVDGMRALGFQTLLPDELQAPIIVTFHMPADPRFDFQVFYDRMRERGYVIYPGKLTVADSFRIGCIGRLGAEQMEGALRAVEEILSEMGVENCMPAAA